MIFGLLARALSPMTGSWPPYFPSSVVTIRRQDVFETFDEVLNALFNLVRAGRDDLLGFGYPGCPPALAVFNPLRRVRKEVLQLSKLLVNVHFILDVPQRKEGDFLGVLPVHLF